MGIIPVPSHALLKIQRGVISLFMINCVAVIERIGIDTAVGPACDPPGGPPGGWLFMVFMLFCIVLAQANLPYAGMLFVVRKNPPTDVRSRVFSLAGMI